MIWRIDDTDPTRPVRLALGGPYPLRLTVTEAMHLLRTAPKMAGKWETSDGADGERTAFRDDTHGKSAAVAWYSSLMGAWYAETPAGIVQGNTLAEAQDAADAALRAAGWLLEEG